MHKHIRLSIQPAYNIQTKRIEYAEILISDYGKLKGAADIIKYVEDNNLELEFDLDIIRKTLDYMGKYVNIAYPVAVNLCYKTLEIKNSALFIKYIISRYRTNTDKLIIEINENTNFNNEIVMENLKILYDAGIKLAFDDFNATENSFNAIKLDYFSYIKIDKSIINYLDNLDNLDNEDENYCKLLNTITYINNKYKHNIIVEGVETVKQLEIVQGIGCEYIQGYLFSKPVRLENFNPYATNLVQ